MFVMVDSLKPLDSKSEFGTDFRIGKTTEQQASSEHSGFPCGDVRWRSVVRVHPYAYKVVFALTHQMIGMWYAVDKTTGNWWRMKFSYTPCGWLRVLCHAVTIEQ